MAVATSEGQPALTSYDEWRTRRWRLTGLAFAILWLVTAVLFVQLGEKQSDLNRLVGAIHDGSVTQVEVVGLPRGSDWRGEALVTLTWEGSVLSRFAEVTVHRQGSRSRQVQGGEIEGDPADFLRGIARPRELDITYSDHTGGQEWHGWRGPGVPAALGLAAWFGTILLAGAGPRPWRATSWAWIWLILFSGPLGSAAYLLLGGPLGLWRPRNPDRRLTGGWAFLLSIILFGGADAG